MRADTGMARLPPDEEVKSSVASTIAARVASSTTLNVPPSTSSRCSRAPPRSSPTRTSAAEDERSVTGSA